MVKFRSFIGVVCAAIAIANAMSPAVAQEGETVTKHFEQAIPNIPGKSLVAFVVDYAPGGASPSHTHAKSAFIFAYVVSGKIESQVNDGPKRVYRAGESFFEMPGSSHPISRNASKTEPAKLLAVFVVDTDDKELGAPFGRPDRAARRRSTVSSAMIAGQARTLIQGQECRRLPREGLMKSETRSRGLVGISPRAPHSASSRSTRYQVPQRHAQHPRR